MVESDVPPSAIRPDDAPRDGIGPAGPPPRRTAAGTTPAVRFVRALAAWQVARALRDGHPLREEPESTPRRRRS